jgi:transcriptional regulator with XRE-family HTH domain
MYYENFEKLCKENKTNPSQVSKATGISTATLTSWKKGVYTPKQDKLQLIADHFKVSVDYIITGKESEFAIEMAETDVELSNMNKRLKEYALKISKMSNDKQEHIMNLIDMLEDKE